MSSFKLRTEKGSPRDAEMLQMSLAFGKVPLKIAVGPCPFYFEGIVNKTGISAERGTEYNDWEITYPSEWEL